jgi:Zn-dependent M28 family amino/carboxypeptidase
VALLELAERLAAGPKPWRSILFVWHTAEELRYLGSQWFTEFPTVPREAIIAEVNLDGVGQRVPVRGDVDGGVQGDLAVIGAGRLSTSFAQLVDEVAQRDGIVFDRRYDAPGDPSDYYCRSDHMHYARFGIPSVFFTTGMYPAYHQLNDEAQYIDYAQLERVTRYVADLTMAVADLDRRPALDPGRTTDPYGPCKQ